jgi:hypothetical protein
MELATMKQPRLRYSRSGILQPSVCDGRSRSARRFRRLCERFGSEIGGTLSAFDQELVSQAAALALRAEQIREAIVAGHEINADEAIRLASECRRILAALMAKADKAKPAAPTLHDLVAAFEDEESEAGS